MKDDRGFSLIELMVVLCIAALLVSGGAVAIRSLHFADAVKCAKEIDTELSTLRMDTMSQGEYYHYLIIEWEDTAQQYNLWIATSKGEKLDSSNWKTKAFTKKSKKLASNLITLAYSTDGIYYTDINTTNPVILISYIPSSGAFESSYKQLRIESESKSSMINMVTKTGNHYIK